jgi:hypothetical protein
MYQGESVKAAVRKLPNAVERLVAARAHCAFLVRRLAGAGGAGEGAGAAAAVEVRPAWAGQEGSGTSEGVARWLQQLEESLLAGVELLQQGPSGGA